MQFTRHRRSRFYRQPCSTAAGQQISPIPNRQPRQTDLCREPRKPGGHRERAELHLRKGGHLRLREDAGNLPDIPNRRGHTPRSGKPCRPVDQGSFHLRTDKCNGNPLPAPGGKRVLERRLPGKAILPHIHRRSLRGTRAHKTPR